MGIVHIMRRGGEDLHDYKRALKMAKKGIEWLCDLSEEMEDKYSYDERDDSDDWDEPVDHKSRRRK